MEHVGTTIASPVDVHATSWGAIISGWLVATGVAFLMYVAGLAIGFAAFDPYDAAATAKGIGVGTAAWMVLTWAVSLFLGGMFASWFDGKNDQTVGALQGITVWGLSVAVSGLLFAFGLTQIAQGAAAMVRGGATVGAAAAGTAARGGDGPAEDAMTGLQAQLTRHVAQAGAGAGQASGGTQPSDQESTAKVSRAVNQLDSRSMAAVASALLKGNTENAKALLAANTSLSQAEIDQILQSLSAQVEKYKAEVQAAADRAARYTAAVMWIIFFSILIALVAAATGGWLGAGHISRVYHLRRYTTTTARAL